MKRDGPTSLSKVPGVRVKQDSWGSRNAHILADYVLRLQLVTPLWLWIVDENRWRLGRADERHV